MPPLFIFILLVLVVVHLFILILVPALYAAPADGHGYHPDGGAFRAFREGAENGAQGGRAPGTGGWPAKAFPLRLGA